jgi:hypothetical protein
MCFHNGPVMCPRSVIMALEVSVLSLGVASGQYYRPWAHNRAIMGHFFGQYHRPTIPNYLRIFQYPNFDWHYRFCHHLIFLETPL